MTSFQKPAYNDFKNYTNFEEAKRVNEIASELVSRKIAELESKKKQIQNQSCL